MSRPGEARQSTRGPVLAALGAGMLLIACCVLAPVLIGAAWMLALGPVAEAVLIAAALVFGAFALWRHRANRCC